MQDNYIVLIVLGSFISLLLMVNAYFTRETLLRVVKIEVALKENSTKQIYIEKQVNDNTYEIKKIRDRVHSLEGGQIQLISYLENIKEQ